jgi:hypothetical protein
MEFYTIQVYSTVGLTSTKYNINKLSMREQRKLRVGIKLSILMELEKIRTA